VQAVRGAGVFLELTMPTPSLRPFVRRGLGLLCGWSLAGAAWMGAQDIQVPPPPITEGFFPCTTCHDGKSLKVNRQRRELKDMHADIILKHGPDSRWCLDCHDALNRDRLHLASGELIEFTVSYELCGQCHGEKLRDWRAGVHGKRTGSWNGQKQYLLCVNCHNPHSPHFQPLKPMPPPVRPEAIQVKKGGAQ
jgi:hypothetical protein